MKPNVAVLLGAVLGLAFVSAAAESQPQRRLLSVSDLDLFKQVSEPAVSPEGQWVAYTVRTADPARDKRSTDIWMASWDGTRNVQLTQSAYSEHTPRWSPDGHYLSFLSNRGEKDGPDELWLLDRVGGEAQQATHFKGGVVDLDWSPDGRQIVLVVMDDPLPGSEEKDNSKDGEADDAPDDDDKAPPPLVIDRFYFKEDETGYLSSRQLHLYLLDVATRRTVALTSGRFSENYPAWSPDGREIAFMSKRGTDPDRSNQVGLYAIVAAPGTSPRLITNFMGDSGDAGWMGPPVWSPNGRDIAFIAASDDPKLIYYAQHRIVVAPAAGGAPRIVSPSLARDTTHPEWSPDGKSLYGLLEDDRNQHLASFDVASGRVQVVLGGRRESTSFDLGPKGRIALLDATPGMPDEIYAFEKGKPRPLSRQNDAWLSRVQLGQLQEISFQSADGTPINGFVLKPPGYTPGVRYPTLLQIHGGPVAQYANSFDLTWQILAAQGYAIVAANPRGSSGRGQKFAMEIYADWGNKDTQDVLAAVDYAVAQGIADPARLGVGGWSYGGILTDNVITRDKRFKAAVSGAGIGNVLAGYGTDMYVREYEAELGVPWKNLDVYIRNSYPFLHADHVVTPTLFVCGEQDFNVPLLNSEQMYQAVRSVGVDTQLVIYPGQFHGFSRPSYVRDRLDRSIAWYGKYLVIPPRQTAVPSLPAYIQVRNRPES